MCRVLASAILSRPSQHSENLLTQFTGACCNSRARLWSGLPWQASRRSVPLISHPSPYQLAADCRTTAEDSMNVQLKDITVTARDGRVSHLDQVYIRGSHVRFFIVPDMLRNAPMFRSRGVKGRGVGLARGRATVSRARASGRGAPR